MKFEKHFKSSFFTALLECRPGKRVLYKGEEELNTSAFGSI